MTRMAGANPKIAAIFGGGDFGLKNDAVNNAAFQDRSALQMAATNADAKAAIGEKEAEAMVEAAKHGAAATRAQGAAAGQSAMFGGLSSGISSLAGGFASSGGFGGGGGLNSGITGSVGGDGGAAAGYFNNYGDSRLVNWLK